MDIDKTKRFYVYALLDPTRDGRAEFWPCTFFAEPFYVGKGRGRRRFMHSSDKRASPLKRQRIEAIHRDGLKPEILLLADNLSEQDALDLERFFIAQIGRIEKREGPLVNATDGGQGMSGHKKSQSARDAVSRAQKGKKRPPEFGAKVSASKRGIPNDKARGVPRPAHVIAKIAAAQRGVPRPHVVGQKRSSETRKRISESRKGFKPSAESIEKMKQTKAKGRTGAEKAMREYRCVIKRLRGLRTLMRQLRPIRQPNYSTRFQPGLIPHNKGKTGCFKWSEEARAQRRGFKHTAETRAKMSASRTGKPRPRYIIEAMLAGQRRAREQR